MSFGTVVRTAKNAITDNSPAILTGLGVASIFTTAVLAVKATPEALRRIWDAESEHARDISTFEKVKIVWPLYVPAVATGVTGTVCVIMSNRISSRRLAVAMGALTISENSYREYQEKTKLVAGEKKEQQIREEIAQDHVNQALQDKGSMVLPPNKHLCVDAFSGRVFFSDYETLRKAQNDVNQMAIHEYGVSLNEFYTRVGLEAIPLGIDLGWSSDDLLELVLTPCLVENGDPAIHVGFHRDPVIDYNRPFR